MSYNASKPEYQDTTNKEPMSRGMFIGIVVLICVLTFVASFLITAVVLDNETTYDQDNIYMIERIEHKDGDTYLIRYRDISANEGDQISMLEEFEIDNFEYPEVGNMSQSYIRERSTTTNSFIGHLLNSNNQTVTMTFYLTPDDREKLDKYGIVAYQIEEPTAEGNGEQND